MARPTILSLFSGVGGLDLGIKLAIPGARVLGYVERDAYAAAVLLARMEDSSLECAPIWIGDIHDLDGGDLHGCVEIICGGFPCQDISVAGKGIGIEGKRSGLWSEIVRLADEIRPRYIFLENVSAITCRGLDTVLADLAEGGFDAEWLCLRASAVGAPHRRERWFCLAYRNSSGREGERLGRLLNGEWTAQRDDTDGCDEGMDDPVQQQRGGRSRERSDEAGGSGGVLADTKRTRVYQEATTSRTDDQMRVAACGASAAVFPPGPRDYTHWRRTVTDGSFDFRAPAVKPGVRVLVDGITLVVDASRADQLRCSGNGVVVLQAAAAIVELLRRIGVNP